MLGGCGSSVILDALKQKLGMLLCMTINLHDMALFFVTDHFNDSGSAVGPVCASNSILSRMENEYWPKCGDALWLGSKGSYG